MASSSAASQIVVVLGAGPGLGQACCRLFAQKGHPVALLSRSKDRLEQLSQQINKEVGDEKRTRAYAVDVKKGEDVKQVFDTIKQDWRSANAHVHTAIFNAGGLFKIKPFLEASEDDFRSAYETQLWVLG